MPAQSVNIRQFVGLHVQANSYGAQVPDGAFEIASNVVFSQDGICKKRRGLAVFSTSTFTDPVAVTEFNGTELVAQHKELYRLDSAGVATPYSDASSLFNISVDGSVPRFATGNGNLLFTSTNGVLKLESTTASIVRAGIPRALDLQITVNATPGIFGVGVDATNNNQVGYRVVFGRKDINNNNILGAPSELTVALNSDAANTKQPVLTFSLPAGIVADEHYFQVYRTEQVLEGPTDPVVPVDENKLQLIYERKLTSTDVTNGYATFTDEIPEFFRQGGAFLYTNPNQETILQANDQPPRCEDVALFKEMMFYANTETKHTLELILIKTTNLLNNSVTFTIGGTTETYTAKASENIGNKEFQRHTTGTDAQNTDNTAKSFCKIINRQSSGKLYAFYLSSVEDIPGKMFIMGRNFSEPFSVTVNSATITDHFLPELPTSGTSVASTNDDLQNAVFISKRGIPEAVPLLNSVRVGSQNDAILRIVPLRDSLIVISEGGVFSIRGEDPSGLTITPIDTTVFCKSKNSVAVLNNTVYMLSSQGIVGVTDTSVQVLSRNVEPLMTSVVGNTYLDMLTRAAAYESERLYLLSTMEPNTRLVTLEQTVELASIASNIATLVLDGDDLTEDVSAGDIVVLSGFTGSLTALNSTFYVQSVTSGTITVRVVNANVPSSVVNNITVQVIGANVVYCYNTVTQSWSTWAESCCFRSAHVNTTDEKLYLLGKEPYVFKERKESNKLDYADRSYSATAGSVDTTNNTSTLALSGYTPGVGDAVVYRSNGADLIAKISAVDGSTYTYDTTPSFSSGNTVTVYQRYESVVLTAPLTLGDVARAKRFMECTLFFRTRSATRLRISFKTNLVTESVPTDWVTVVPAEGWGYAPWGYFPWGLPAGIDSVYVTEKNQHARVYVPREAGRGNYLQLKVVHSVATEVFDLQSTEFLVYASSTDTTR